MLFSKFAKKIIMNGKVTESKPSIEGYNDLLLDIGSTLMVSGAHCGRIDRNIKRIADVFGIDVETFYSFNGLILTTKMKGSPSETATHHKRLPSHGVHFGVLNEISLLSWRTVSDNLSYEEVRKEFEKIKSLAHHRRLQILFGVAIACASLCILAKGNYIDAAFAFVASFAGMYVRQEITKRKFNVMIAIIGGAFVTSFIASINVYYGFGSLPEKALATSVLYLVPGVQLVNSVIDLIEGYVATAIARGVYSGFLLLCIAAGMAFSILIFGIQNFH